MNGKKLSHSSHSHTSCNSFIPIEIHPDKQRIKRIGAIGAVFQTVFFAFGQNFATFLIKISNQFF
jgi:hypothetical protein